MSDGYFTQQVFAEVLGRRKMLKYYLKALSILTKLDFGLTRTRRIEFGLHQLLALVLLVEVQQVQEVPLHPGLVRSVIVAEILDHNFPLADSFKKFDELQLQLQHGL
jgi:hypothetical protein